MASQKRISDFFTNPSGQKPKPNSNVSADPTQTRLVLKYKSNFLCSGLTIYVVFSFSLLTIFICNFDNAFTKNIFKSLSYLRLAMRLLLRPIPRHFSKCGAKREAAMLRLQLGHTHSLFFHWLYTCPNTSTPGWSTISGKVFYYSTKKNSKE